MTSRDGSLSWSTGPPWERSSKLLVVLSQGVLDTTGHLRAGTMGMGEKTKDKEGIPFSSSGAITVPLESQAVGGHLENPSFRKD